MIYDVDAARAGATRASLLAEVAADRTIVAGAHLPAPGFGVIVRDGDGYRFEPGG